MGAARASLASMGLPHRTAERGVRFALVVATRLVPSLDRGSRTHRVGTTATEARYDSREGCSLPLMDFFDSCLGNLVFAAVSNASLAPAGDVSRDGDPMEA